eukprot:UN08864
MINNDNNIDDLLLFQQFNKELEYYITPLSQLKDIQNDYFY